MNTLKGLHINLRAIEPTDLAFLYQIENDELFWEVSNTQKPFSKYLLQQYLENAQQDIYEAKQLRLLIEEKNGTPVGLIDLFDFDPKHKRAGIGIVISQQFQAKGFATESLELLLKFAFTHLNLHQLFANITNDNTKSISLFEKVGFQKAGIKKDWIFSNGKFKNELLYQIINE
ncbi:MAG: GNAT family protein [Flavobacteriaceae bacterium]